MKKGELSIMGIAGGRWALAIATGETKFGWPVVRRTGETFDTFGQAQAAVKAREEQQTHETNPLEDR